MAVEGVKVVSVVVEEKVLSFKEYLEDEEF